MKHKFRWVNNIKQKPKQKQNAVRPGEWYKYLISKGAFK